MSTPPQNPQHDPNQPAQPHSASEAAGWDDVNGQPRYGMRLPQGPDAAAQPTWQEQHGSAGSQGQQGTVGQPDQFGQQSQFGQQDTAAPGQSNSDERPGWDQARPGSRRAAREAAASSQNPSAGQYGQPTPGQYGQPGQPTPGQYGQPGQPTPGQYGQQGQYGQPAQAQAQPPVFGQQQYPGAFVPGGPYDHTGQVPQGPFSGNQAGQPTQPGQPFHPGQQGQQGQPGYQGHQGQPGYQGQPAFQGYQGQQGYGALPGFSSQPTSAGSRPTTITVAGVLLWVGAALAVVLTIIGVFAVPTSVIRQTLLSDTSGQDRADLERMLTPGFLQGVLWFVVILYVVMAGTAVLVGLQTWKGSNAWRIVGTVCGGIAVLFNLFTVLDSPLSILLFLMAAAIIVLWWLPVSNAWFKAKKAEKKQQFAQPMGY
ncbi:FUSC family protein [Galactobacter caseinivorans]|uniref:DUF4064 domain-containing protein n=1 Tax=Galactobacter caseinivorans TaxID=2676123 RepID=A0A496PLK7_9MICC|nr:hypothetical protein [Galactobacter caseinivorans]RKW71346.1 hypothetical protein DWQ67_00315 [Galactobacter caseinivorans]